MRHVAVDDISHAIIYVAELTVLLYVTLFPVACLKDNTRVPVLLRPMAHLLETPLSPEIEMYLRLWHVDPDIVRCAMYEP